jgi:hypothetical protein
MKKVASGRKNRLFVKEVEPGYQGVGVVREDHPASACKHRT